MNKRIKELAEQAEFSARDLHIQNDNFQKFAELIVRECVKKVRARQMFDIEDQNSVHHAFDLLVYDLESHFGVEE